MAMARGRDTASVETGGGINDCPVNSPAARCEQTSREKVLRGSSKGSISGVDVFSVRFRGSLGLGLKWGCVKSLGCFLYLQCYAFAFRGWQAILNQRFDEEKEVLKN